MFEAASQAGIFLSKFQRSTYNVDHLKGQPYWTPDELGLTVKEKSLTEIYVSAYKISQWFMSHVACDTVVYVNFPTELYQKT